MQTEALLDISQRGEELRYVTKHFRDLQGLRLAPIWAGFLVLTGVASSNSLSRGRLTESALAIVLLGLGWFFWSGRWYERRYGLVTHPDRSIPSGVTSIMNPEIPPSSTGNYRGYGAVYLLVAALYTVRMLFRRFDSHYDQFSMNAVLFLLLPRCFYRAPANILIRLRNVLSIAGSITTCAMCLSYLFAQLGKWPYVAAGCAILLLLDVYDHWLFTRLLSSRSMEVSHE